MSKDSKAVSRGNWDEKLMEGENAFFEGLFSTPALLGGALFLYGGKPWHSYVTYTLVFMAGCMILVWFILHALPPTISFLKPYAVKVIDFVCKPVQI